MNIQDEFNNFNENNDIDELRILLNVFYISIKNNNIENIKFFLNNPKFNPATNRNNGIRIAAKNGFYNIVNILWKEQKVKETLKKDDIDLYNELIKKDKIKDKVEGF